MLYYRHLQKRISSLDYKIVYFNLTKGKRDAIFSFKKEAGKGCPVVAWHRKVFLRESKYKLVDNNVYEKVPIDVKGHLQKIIKTVFRKVRWIISKHNGLFPSQQPLSKNVYLPPKIHN